MREENPSTDEDEALAANDAFYRAFNQKDTELMASVWSAADGVSCVHPGWNVLTGREAVLDSWRRILENPGQPRIVSGGADVACFGDLALVVCRELVAGSPLVATNIFVREDGGWKLRHHQSGPVYSA